jgi:hypothetical protein
MRYSTKSADSREEQRVVTTVRIDEAEPVMLGRRRTAWRAESVTATYERWRTNGEPWGRWVIMNVVVRGRNVKRDGSDGAEDRHRLWRRPEGGEEESPLAPIYDEVVRRTPSATMPLALYREAALAGDPPVIVSDLDEAGQPEQ